MPSFGNRKFTFSYTISDCRFLSSGESAAMRAAISVLSSALAGFGVIFDILQLYNINRYLTNKSTTNSIQVE